MQSQNQNMGSTIHRYTKIGESLIETLQEMKQKQQINSDQEMKILGMFDSIMVKLLNSTTNLQKGNMKGHLTVYNNCDNVWSFILKDVQLSTESIDMLQLPLLKIITVDQATENVISKKTKKQAKKKLNAISDKTKQIQKKYTDNAIHHLTQK